MGRLTRRSDFFKGLATKDSMEVLFGVPQFESICSVRAGEGGGRGLVLLFEALELGRELRN